MSTGAPTLPVAPVRMICIVIEEEEEEGEGRKTRRLYTNTKCRDYLGRASSST